MWWFKEVLRFTRKKLGYLSMFIGRGKEAERKKLKKVE